MENVESALVYGIRGFCAKPIEMFSEMRRQILGATWADVCSLLKSRVSKNVPPTPLPTHISDVVLRFTFVCQNFNFHRHISD